MAVKANQSKGPLDHGKSHLCYVLSVSGFFFFLLRKRKFWTREISVCYTFFLNANNIHEMILCDVTFLHIVRRDGIYFVIFKFVFFFSQRKLSCTLRSFACRMWTNWKIPRFKQGNKKEFRKKIFSYILMPTLLYTLFAC